MSAQGVTQWTQTWNGTFFEPEQRVPLFGKNPQMSAYPLTLFQMGDEEILLAGVLTTGRLFISKISLEIGTILWNQTLPEDYLGGFNDH
ncbi:MAG: hypothetical protein ACFE9L_14280 [Candidatus Hodarchaeota archaeon]